LKMRDELGDKRAIANVLNNRLIYLFNTI